MQIDRYFPLQHKCLKSIFFSFQRINHSLQKYLFKNKSHEKLEYQRNSMMEWILNLEKFNLFNRFSEEIADSKILLLSIILLFFHHELRIFSQMRISLIKSSLFFLTGLRYKSLSWEDNNVNNLGGTFGGSFKMIMKEVKSSWVFVLKYFYW